MKSGTDQDIAQALQDFVDAPDRGEVLHALARFYLGRSRGDLAFRVASAGLWLPAPDDTTETAVYAYGLREAFYIAASYASDATEKARGRAICHWLMLDPTVPESTRHLARMNYHWFAEPAVELLPSIRFTAAEVTAPEGFKPGNISVMQKGDGFLGLVRCVNYDLLESGYFTRHGDSSFRQRTVLVEFDSDLLPLRQAEVSEPADLPPPAHTDSLGFEDPRPFAWGDTLWSLSNLRQLNAEGRAEMVLARIAADEAGGCRFTDWRVLSSGRPERWEKNWMPAVTDDGLRLVYELDPTRVIDDAGAELSASRPSLAMENIRGGTQLVPFGDGWLAVVHEWYVLHTRRHYLHRFVRFDAAWRVVGLTRPFYFRQQVSEFAAGLAWYSDGKRLLLSFGVDDRSPSFATVEAAEIETLLGTPAAHAADCAASCAAGRADWRGLLRQARAASVAASPGEAATG